MKKVRKDKIYEQTNKIDLDIKMLKTVLEYITNNLARNRVVTR